MRRFALAGLAALAFPAAADAATLTPTGQCVSEGARIGVIGAGFTPGAAVTINAGELGTGQSTSNTLGAFGGVFTAPARSGGQPGTRLVTITASDAAGVMATTQVRLAELAFTTASGTRAPHAERTYKISGLVPDKPVYAHYRFKGRTRGNRRLGVAGAPCGELTARAPGIVGRIRAGTWTVVVDQARRFSPRTRPQIRATTRIFLLPR